MLDPSAQGGMEPAARNRPGVRAEGKQKDKETRRSRLDRPRQAGGHDLHPCGSVIKRLFQAKRVGHAGTLDPLASGCLPIALGEATKTVPFVVDSRKNYQFTIRWGEERDTDDAEGRVVATSELRPDAAAIRAQLPRFTGTIEQVPPLSRR